MEEVESFIPPTDTERQTYCVLGYWARCWKYNDKKSGSCVQGSRRVLGAGSGGSKSVITMEWMGALMECSRLLWERVQEARLVALKRR